jgi:ribonucleoside-diphosphate reductase alpha chain
MIYNPSAEDFLSERYFRDGEDWKGMITRVAKAHAKTDEEFNDYFGLMNEGKALPSTPILMNSGTELGFLSACNVLPVEDDLGEIFDAIKVAGMLQKMGGGVGFNFSKLRPTGDIISKTGGTSSGVVSFLQGFDACSKMVKQGGKRRGANMGLLAMWHPDILQWVNAKHRAGLIETFNLSVGLTGEIFSKDGNGEKITFVNPRTKQGFAGLDPLRSTAEKEFRTEGIAASELLQRIAQEIWHNGEPGVLFWDTIQKGNSTPWLGNLQGVNPCGEVPMYFGESCCLASINLYAHLVKNDGWHIDYDEVAKTTRMLVKFLNAVLDDNKYPFIHLQEKAFKTRKIGIGIMGFTDCLYRMGVEYGSTHCMHLINAIMRTIKKFAEKESERLAELYGPYPAWVEPAPKRRNANLIAIAPTGSISFILGVSSGIEPAYKIAYMMRRKEKPALISVDKGFRDLLEERSPDKAKDIINLMIEKDKSPNVLIDEGILDSDIYSHVVTATEVTPDDHIKVLAAFQKHTDLAVSKTVNLPYNTTAEDIKRLLKKAYDLGCKGLTMFREGCFREAFLTEVRCQACGSTRISMGEGCMKCLDCGASMCAVA